MDDTGQIINERQTEKKPFRNIKCGVNQIINKSIPHYLEKLHYHRVNISKYESEENWMLVQQEQVNASNAVRSLKANIRCLEELNFQLRDEDQEKFLDMVKLPIHEVTEELSKFLALHSDVMSPFPEVIKTDSVLGDVPKLTCDLEESSANKDDKNNEDETNALQQLQIYDEPSPIESKYWGKLKNDIIELNKLFKSLANNVFSQKQEVNTIEDNVQQATDNVLSGTRQLRRAVLLKSALFPIAGAALGSLLGPAGAIIGFHAFGSALCTIGGCITGFAIGRRINNSHHVSSEIEMQAIENSSRPISESEPDLPATTGKVDPALTAEN